MSWWENIFFPLFFWGVAVLKSSMLTQLRRRDHLDVIHTELWLVERYDHCCPDSISTLRIDPPRNQHQHFRFSGDAYSLMSTVPLMVQTSLFSVWCATVSWANTDSVPALVRPTRVWASASLMLRCLLASARDSERSCEETQRRPRANIITLRCSELNNWVRGREVERSQLLLW